MFTAWSLTKGWWSMPYTHFGAHAAGIDWITTVLKLVLNGTTTAAGYAPQECEDSTC